MYIYITKQIDAGTLLSSLLETEEIGIDVETTSLDVFDSKLLLLGIECKNTCYILDAVKLGTDFIRYVLSVIKENNILCVGHNVKYDAKILMKETNIMLTNLYDTMIAETLIYQGLGKHFYMSLEDLLMEYMMIDMDKSVRKTFENHKGDFTNEQLLYSATDIKHLRTLKNLQLKKLDKRKQIGIVELESSLISIFANMEYDGIILDKEKWLTAEKEFANALDGLEKELFDILIEEIDFSSFENAYKLAMEFDIPVKTKKLQKTLEQITDANYAKDWFIENFNLNSYRQKLKFLHYIGIECESTDQRVLSKIKQQHVFIPKVLEYSENKKKISTYGENFLDNINNITGRIHTEFNQVGTATGRISSERPNLQNIPALKIFRKSFVATPGWLFITADYSQAELRLLGAVSGEPEFIDAYKKDLDLHKKSATFLFNKSIEEINSEERQKGKTLNFGVVYGISEWGLYNNFGIPLDIGREYLSNYFSGYKILKKFIEVAGDKILENLYSVTPFGRKRFFEDKTFFVDWKEKRKYESKIRREGVNHIIQGGSADIVKLAMRDIYYNNPFGKNLRILLQEHDEIVLESRIECAEEAEEFVIETMLKAEQPFLGEIPAKVESKIEEFWSK